MRLWILLLSLALLTLGRQNLAAEEMRAFQGCTLIPTEWADGDSFRARFPDGKQHTVRLYGADCMELKVDGETDARRLRAQRRYFGISNLGGGAAPSIAKAKEFGARAKRHVQALLDTKFTVHTAFADARGDGRFIRIYGYVELDDGRDLGEVLVAAGLARAFGVKRDRPGIMRGSEYMERLRDLELKAAKVGAGIWEHADWDALPGERRLQRDEEAELAAAIDGSAQPPAASIDPNTAARDVLMALPGVGEEIANRIIEGREHGPYSRPEDLARVHGLGTKKIETMRRFLTFSDED